MTDFDVVVIGAGHNGLTAAGELARGGARVLVLERAHFIGGMAATRELFPGFKHSVGAWALIAFRPELIDRLELPQFGFELIDPWSSACTFGYEGSVPFVMYNNLERQATHVFDDHGEQTATALAQLFMHIRKFGPYFSESAYGAAPNIHEVIADQPDAQSRRDFAQMWFGSTMDIVRRFMTPEMAPCLQGSLATMSIDGCYAGPWTPGTGASTLFHYLLNGLDTPKFMMPRGGIGALSASLQRRAEHYGAEVNVKTEVRSLLVDGGKVTGVRLKNGSEISARAVVSTLDANKTFLGLLGEEHLPGDFARKVREVRYNEGYIQAHLTLDGEPTWVDWLQPFATDNGSTCPTMAFTPSAEYVSDAWDQYRRGKLPERPPAYLYLPSLVDPTLAPRGKHTATIFAPYFPTDLTPDAHRSLKEQYADNCIAVFEQHAPGFVDLINDKVVLANRYFHSTFGATDGDYAQGLIDAGQMWSDRLPGESTYGTPLEGLFIGGSAAHPGPGVTCLPGLNSAKVVLRHLEALVPTR